MKPKSAPRPRKYEESKLANFEEYLSTFFLPLVGQDVAERLPKSVSNGYKPESRTQKHPNLPTVAQGLTK